MTINGEKPIDIAKRYHYDEIVQYLEWIGKQCFIDFSFDRKIAFFFLLLLRSDTKQIDTFN